MAHGQGRASSILLVTDRSMVIPRMAPRSAAALSPWVRAPTLPL